MVQIIFFLIAIVGLLFNKSKIVNRLLIAYVLIVMAFNSYNPDYRSYNIIYQNPDAAQEEIGFRFLCKIGNALGFSYDIFHIIIVTLGLFLLIRGIKILFEYEKVLPTNFYLISYMFFPMMLDVILIRSFLSTCIMIYSLHFLYKNQKGKYAITIIAASSIHASSLLFLFLLLKKKTSSIEDNEISWKKMKEKLHSDEKKRIWIKIATIILIFILLIMLRTQILQMILSTVGFNALKIQLWLDGSNITLRMIILCVLLNLTNFGVYTIIRRMTQKREYFAEMIQIDNLMFVINYVLLINIVLMIYSEQFIRLLGVGIMINSIFYSIILRKERRQKRRWSIISLGLIPAIVLFAYRMFAYITPDGTLYIEYVFKCILENNFLLDLFK